MLRHYHIEKNLTERVKEFELSPKALSESFGVGPFGLDQVANLAGMKLYSSVTLRQKFIESIADQDETKQVSKSIANLVNKNVIIPCYSSSGFISFIGHKMFGSPYEKAIMAFFSPISNRVYMLFDNRVDFLIWTSDEDLSKTLLHELQHFACYNLKTRYASLFNSMWKTYYTAFFNGIFENQKLTGNDIKPVYAMLLKSFEWTKSDIREEFFTKTYHSVIHKLALKCLNAEEAKNFADEYISNLLLYLQNPDKYITEIRYNTSGTPRLVYNYLNRSYMSLGYRNPESIFVQELLFPSEICSITAGERPMAPHYMAIKLLDKITIK
jgi:hypothetical protein